jgi:hypothetical protein
MVLIVLRIVFNCKLNIINNVRNGKFSKNNANIKKSFGRNGTQITPEAPAHPCLLRHYSQ